MDRNTVLPRSEDYDVCLQLGAISKSEAILREGLDSGTIFDLYITVNDMSARSSV